MLVGKTIPPGKEKPLDIAAPPKPPDIEIISDDKRMRNAFIRITAINNTKSGVVEYTFADIQKVVDDWLLTKNFEYFIIEHCNEDGTNLHWHIVLNFPANSTCEFRTLKNKFPYGYISNCKFGVKACVRYIKHEDRPDKTQYKWEDIITNAPARLEFYKIPTPLSNDMETQIILNQIIAGKIKEFEIYKIPPHIYIKNRTIIKNAFEYRRLILLNDPTRNVTVIVLQGATRLGKSTFCKVWTDKEKKSCYFSSSGRDFFGEYLGQDIVILDDFNYEAVKINDFKRLIDPHFNGSVDSRYFNKLFIGDTIFICTNQPITDWFPTADDKDRDAIFSRISFVLDFKSYEELTSSDLSIFDADSKLPKYSEKVSYYTYNKLCREEITEDAFDKFGRPEIGVKKIYGKWQLKPTEDKIREFDLKRYINIEADKTKEEDFRKKLDEI